MLKIISTEGTWRPWVPREPALALSEKGVSYKTHSCRWTIITNPLYFVEIIMNYLVVQVLEANLKNLCLNRKVDLVGLTLLEPAWILLLQGKLSYFRGSRQGACWSKWHPCWHRNTCSQHYISPVIISSIMAMKFEEKSFFLNWWG